MDDEPALADRLHPRAHLEEHGAKEKDTKIAVAEGGEGAPTGSQTTPRGSLLGCGEGARGQTESLAAGR